MTRERFATVVVCVHLIAAALHGTAHGALSVPAGGPAAVLLVAVSVYLGPLIALALLRRRRRVEAALLLTSSMTTALIYGIVFHYLVATPDRVAHVAEVAPGAWADAFRATAAVIAILEGLGAVAGLLLLRGVPTHPDGRGRRATPFHRFG